MKLRILHTESSCGWGGQELRILTESQGMIARGHDVHLVADPSSRIAEQCLRYGLVFTALPIRAKSIEGFVAMRRFIDRHNFDVINVHSSTDAWLVSIAAASMPAAPPIVRTRHISAPFKNNFMTRWLYNRACETIVTTGEALRQDMIRTLGTPPSRVVSIPTGIDTDAYRPGDAQLRTSLRASLGLPSNAYLVGIVATLRSWKGHSYLIDALASLPLAAPAGNWHLVIVGDGPQRENLVAQIAAMGLQDRVTMVGHRDDPVEWFRSLDLFCLPSYANEGIPQALMQAMACGLPCVTTNVGAIPEAIEHGVSGIVIEPRNIEAMKQALARLAADAGFAGELGAAARSRAEQSFGRARMIEQMLGVFQKMAKGRAASRSSLPVTKS